MNQVVLITGAAKRLGQVIARAAAARGCDVAVHYRSGREQAEETVDSLLAMGIKAGMFHAELTDPTQVQTLFNMIESSLGPVRFLVNSASIFAPCAMMDTEVYEVEHFISVNLVAQYQVTRNFVQRFTFEDGAIVNMLDWRAWRPDPWFLAYNMAKAGLLNMTKNLAVDLAPKIRVNGVAPGAILPAEHEHQVIRPGPKGVPADRWGTPEEVAAAVMFLLLDAPYITGQVIPVDGGKHLV